MTDDRGDETHTKINASIQTKFDKKTVRYLLAAIIGGGVIGGTTGILHTPRPDCRHYENELVQWRYWARERAQHYPKTDKAGFWAGAPISLQEWKMAE